jgi:hypothetical protein
LCTPLAPSFRDDGAEQIGRCAAGASLDLQALPRTPPNETSQKRRMGELPQPEGAPMPAPRQHTIAFSFRAAILLGVVATPAAAATGVDVGSMQVAPRFDVYSESSYVSRLDLLANSSRVRAELPVKTWLAPYAVAGDELYQRSLEGRDGLDNGSHTFVAPGVRFDWSPVSLFVESRYRSYTDPRLPGEGEGGIEDTRPVRDRRALLVVSLWSERSLTGWQRTRAFNEVYSETVYTSADDDNVVHSTFVRPGVRFEPRTRTYLDAFAKPYVAFDRAGHDYDNRAELEAGGRVTQGLSWLSLSLSATYLVNRSFDYAADASTGSRSNQGYRLLAVLGGAT